MADKADVCRELRLSCQLFESDALRSIADDQQFKTAILVLKDLGSLKEEGHAFGGHQPAHEDNHGYTGQWNQPRYRLAGVEPVGYHGHAGKMQKAAQPLRLSDIGGGARAKEAPGEGKYPEFTGGKPALRGIAAQTFGVPAGHEMTRAWRRPALDEELTIGTNRLEAVVLDDKRLCCYQGHN